MKGKIKSNNLIQTILVLVIIILTLNLLHNQFLAFKEAREAAAAEMEALTKAQLRVKQLATMEENSRELKEQLNRYDQMLPDGPQEDSLINNLKIIANRSGVQLTQIKFEERVKKDSYVEMPFKVSFEGRYNNLLNLLQEMPNGPRTLRIDNIKIGKGQKELPVIQLDVSAGAFHLLQDK